MHESSTKPGRLQRAQIQLHRASGALGWEYLDRELEMRALMFRQNQMMILAPQGLLYILLAILANLRTTFAYPQTIIVSDDATVGSISGNPSTTVPADDSGSFADDNSQSDTLDVIGNQSFGVQFGGGFVVGCVIGVLCYILYRIISNCVRRRGPGRRNRSGGSTHESEVDDGLEAGGS